MDQAVPARREPSANCLAGRWLLWASAAVLALAASMLLAHSMRRPLVHDEHQFVVSAVVLARRGLVPSRDYPYFHLPYLVYIYAAAMKVSDHLLLVCRLIEVIGSIGIIAAVFCASLKLFVSVRPIPRFLIATASVALLMMHPIFLFTTGRAWNHDLPTFLSLLAIGALFRSLLSKHPFLLHVMAGLLMGVSIGVRMTFAPVALAMVTIPLMMSPSGHQRKLKLASTFSAGVIIALLPAILFALSIPRQFLFDNFSYPLLNRAYRQQMHFHEAMDLRGKLSYILHRAAFAPIELQPDEWPAPPGKQHLPLLLRSSSAMAILFIASIAAAAVRWRRIEPRVWRAIACMILVIAGAAIGALAPTPSYPVYFFTPLVLCLVLMLMLASAAFKGSGAGWIVALMLASAIAIANGGAHYPLNYLCRVHQWEPIRVHQVGVQIAQSLPPGATVLSLSPLYASEGNVDIFEQYTTGPFAFRVAATNDWRARILAPLRDVKTIFNSRSPHAVLTGDEPDLDKQLLAGLTDQNLQPRRAGHLTLWVPPTATNSSRAPSAGD